MSRQDFIDALKRALYGKIDDFTLADHIQYYEGYIAQEIASGKSEQEVLNELGDPRLIARTLLEAADTKTSSYTEYIVTDREGSSPEPEARIRRYEGWKAMAVTVFFILVFFLIVVLVFQIVAALLPLLIVIGVIGWLIKKMTSQ
ncbi:MAG: DUF1700 domain-containing protein [Lachnospiraceae bacterium]